MQDDLLPCGVEHRPILTRLALVPGLVLVVRVVLLRAGVLQGQPIPAGGHGDDEPGGCDVAERVEGVVRPWVHLPNDAEAVGGLPVEVGQGVHDGLRSEDADRVVAVEDLPDDRHRQVEALGLPLAGEEAHHGHDRLVEAKDVLGVDRQVDEQGEDRHLRGGIRTGRVRAVRQPGHHAALVGAEAALEVFRGPVVEQGHVVGDVDPQLADVLGQSLQLIHDGLEDRVDGVQVRGQERLSELQGQVDDL